MIKQQVTIQNIMGIHTRAAAKLVDTAKGFESRIELIHRDHTVNCKSIMGLITLGARKDDVLELVISGADEEDALKAIVGLIDAKFGEN